jgi:hypothetical protein
LQETRKRLERELEHTFNTDKPAAASGSDSESDDDGWDSTRNMSVEERQRWFLTKIKQVRCLSCGLTIAIRSDPTNVQASDTHRCQVSACGGHNSPQVSAADGPPQRSQHEDSAHRRCACGQGRSGRPALL